MDTAFAAFVAEGLGGERFSLLDVGCSGGIDPRWRAFGPRLRAIGIDASRAECARLAAGEKNPEIEYVPAFVVGKAGDTVDLAKGQASPLILKVRDRLSVMRSLEIRARKLSASATEEKVRHNAWEKTELADPATPVVVPDLLAARGWRDLDYLKIDIDGSDFEVLKSFEGRFTELQIPAVQLEVNFVGTADAADHTFHNTDRFMRTQGYELFRLDVRTYSARALPTRYVWPTPAETLSGRPFQGEAFYARDVDADLPPPKLAKLAAIFSLWGVPDLAAELIQRRSAVPNTAKALDLLAAQVQPDRVGKLAYADYLKSFEADSASFYRREGNISLGERLAAAWQAFRKPRP